MGKKNGKSGSDFMDDLKAEFRGNGFVVFLPIVQKPEEGMKFTASSAKKAKDMARQMVVDGAALFCKEEGLRPALQSTEPFVA
jgi:hypothetical protein